MTKESTRTTPRIEAAESPPGVRIVDPIESAAFTLQSDGDADPEPCDAAPFAFPVDAAATVDVAGFETPYAQKALVHDPDGTVVAESCTDEPITVEDGRYDVELTSTPMKIYVHVNGGVTLTAGDDALEIAFADGSDVRVGARSLHERPAATITTTDDPEDVMTAISYLGSALKTTSPERSFPTLRGHPPLIERGSALDVPDALSRPDTDVEIAVPPDLEAVFPVASLAYYLGARVRPGPEPALRAGDETFDLTAAGDVATTAARTLEQVFTLDCVTRTEGYYRIDLAERRTLENAVDLAFEDLYDRPLAEQVAAYLDVPYERVAEAVPRWKLTADVHPVAEHAPVLPHLANELAHVRCPTDVATVENSHGVFEAVDDADAPGPGFVEPPPADSFEHAYVGDGIPLGASKTPPAAYRRRLERAEREGSQIRVAVVINDERLRDESAVIDAYGAPEHREFDVTVREGASVAELRDLLRTEFDFLHYVGHVDERGMECVDGFLDARSLDATGVSAFFLNACHSYGQGRALVDAGALGGVVTLDAVLDPIATAVGVALARLLAVGYSLAAALDVLPRANRVASSKYLVVGDGNAQVAEDRDPTPYVVVVEPHDGEFLLRQVAYPSTGNPLGAIGTTLASDDDLWFLTAGEQDPISLSADELDGFMENDRFPVAVGDALYWSDEVTAADLTAPE